jgi:acyl-coenzyme A thioesterase PaaI-like protein
MSLRRDVHTYIPLEPPLVPSTPYNGWTPDWTLALRSGIEAIGWGGPPRVDPLGNLVGIDATELAPGAVTFTMPITDWLTGSDGEMVPGFLAVLADHALSGAVLTTLPPLRGMITVDLALSFVDAPGPDATGLTCKATAHPGSADLPALATATIEDDRGRPLAQAMARCAVFEIPDGAFGDAAPPTDPPDKPAILARAPTRTSAVAGQPLDHDFRRATSGLDLLRGLAAGEHPQPPVYHLTGLRPLGAEPSTATFEMPATRWLGSFSLNVQGGMLALFAGAAASGAVETTLAPGERQRLVSLRTAYARPVPTNEAPIRATAKIAHRGQTVAFSEVAITDADGRELAFASATHGI